MTVGEKYRFQVKRTVDPISLMRMSFGVAIDQWRVHPDEWGSGWTPLGERAASHFGQRLIKHQAMFAVQALDHEDPHHFSSRRRAYKARVWDAVKYTFVSRRDNGSVGPAYAEFVGVFAAGGISRLWFPDRYHTVGWALEAGSTSLAIDVGMNELREFWPDIKTRVFHLKH